MAVPSITATSDVKTYVADNVTPAINDLLSGLATARKLADAAVAAQSGNAAYQAALVNVERACVDFQNSMKFLLP